jgi:deoxyribonuclease V
MINNTLHPLTLNPDEAIRMQQDLRQKLVLTWDGRNISTIGGVAFHEIAGSVVAAISVHRYPDLTPISTSIGEVAPAFPYIPGLLVYRVGPAILNAWQKLSLYPDLLLVHAHGIAHPRGMGLASHVGLWLNIPIIGVAKTLLYGCESDVSKSVGDWTELLDEHHSKRVIGAVLRTCDSAKPVYVSAGHMIDLKHSVAFVLACCRDHRLPEPIRFAQQALSAFKKPGYEKLINRA